MMAESARYLVAIELIDPPRLVLTIIIAVLAGAFLIWFWIYSVRDAIREWRARRRANAVGNIAGLVTGLIILGFILRPSVAEVVIGGVRVEGIVQGYTHTEYRGKIERVWFTVGSKRFEYPNRYGRNSQITRLGDTGRGPLRDGLYLRIEHRDGKILRVEVRE